MWISMNLSRMFRIKGLRTASDKGGTTSFPPSPHNKPLPIFFLILFLNQWTWDLSEDLTHWLLYALPFGFMSHWHYHLPSGHLQDPNWSGVLHGQSVSWQGQSMLLKISYVHLHLFGSRKFPLPGYWEGTCCTLQSINFKACSKQQIIVENVGFLFTSDYGEPMKCQALHVHLAYVLQ